jgi:predicted NBD/HSP70 family sugar kinase
MSPHQMSSAKKSKQGRVLGINSKVGRDINRALMLNAIRQHQPISRAKISELTNLNKSTVSSIVASLLEEDLLVESLDRNGGVGRNPLNLSIKNGKHFVGAISLDAPSSKLAIVDIDGTIKARKDIRTSAVSPEVLVKECIAGLNTLRSKLGPHRFHGIGASVAGIVDSAQSRVVYAANLGWSNVALGNIIRDQVPDIELVSVENDAKASALAELLLGKHTLTSTNLVYLLLTAGIGAGIAVGGRILSGNTHAAGEVGHMTVVDGGEPCACGNSGCWELYASDRAPVRWYANAKKVSSKDQAEYLLSDVIGAARAGDADAREALRLWAQHIGVGIGDMICILDPEVVIVGGSIQQAWDMVSNEVNEAARGRGAFARQRTARILSTSLCDDPPLLGAAALSIRKIFADFRIAL